MSENQPNEKLISLLALGSHFLRDLDDDFHQVVRAHDLKMISIVELHDTPQPQVRADTRLIFI
jgi:hypothetical protein